MIFTSDGDLLSRMRLDIRDFEKALDRAQGKVTRFTRTSKPAVEGLSGSLTTLWKRFGAVALGFNIVYRAMNLFNTALYTLTAQIYDSIKAIDEFEKGIIATSAAIVAVTKTENPFQTYIDIFPEVRSTMQEIDLIQRKHLVNADQLRATYSAFIKKGIVPVTKRDLENVAVFADTIKIFARNSDQIHQYMQETFSSVEGTLRKGNELAYLFKELIPNYKEQVKLWKESGKDINNNVILLEEFRKVLGAIPDIQNLIQGLWTTQLSTIQSYWTIIKRAGAEVLYTRAVGILEDLNKSLMTATGSTRTLAEVAATWALFIEQAWQWARILSPLVKTLTDDFAELQFVLKVMANIAVIVRTAMEGAANAVGYFGAAVIASISDILAWLNLVDTALVNPMDILIELKDVLEEIGKKSLADLVKISDITADKFEGATNRMGNSIKLLGITVAETRTLWDAWLSGIDEVEKKYGDAFEQMEDLSETTAKSMRDAMKTWFFDLTKQDAKDWSDYLNMIGDAVAQKFADQMANMFLAETGLQTFFAGLFKGGGDDGVIPTGGSVPVQYWHDGGIVPLAPRLHKGLAADEFHAILQSGETVLPRGVQPSNNNYNISISAIDAQSFDDIMRRHPQSVLAPFVEAIEQGDRQIINRLRSVV